MVLRLRYPDVIRQLIIFSIPLPSVLWRLQASSSCPTPSNSSEADTPHFDEICVFVYFNLNLRGWHSPSPDVEIAIPASK